MLGTQDGKVAGEVVLRKKFFPEVRASPSVVILAVAVAAILVSHFDRPRHPGLCR